MIWLKSLALAAVAVFAPVHAVLGAVFALVVLDAITGVMAARKRGEPITSARLRRSVSKLFVFEVVVLAGFLAETILLGGALPVVKLAAAAIGLVELTSTVENANAILGRNLFAGLLAKVGSQNDTQAPKGD